MADHSLLVALRASRPDTNITRADFAGRFSLEEEDGVAVSSDLGRGCSSVLEFAPVAKAGHGDLYEEAKVALFHEVAAFLDRHPASLYDAFRRAGIRVRAYIDIRTDQDQFQLSFPEEFLRACGRAGISVELISNDISAAEAIAAGWE